MTEVCSGDVDDKDAKNQMERIRLAVSSHDIDQFSTKLQRNMMDIRQHFDIKDRISIKKTINFMKKNIPIDEGLSITKKLEAFSVANDFEFKTHEGGYHIISDDFLISIDCENESIKKVLIGWFYNKDKGLMDATNIKRLINENKFKILSRKIQIYSRMIDSQFTKNEKIEMFEKLIQLEERLIKDNCKDPNGGKYGKFFKRTDIDRSFISMFCDKIFNTYELESINEYGFKAYIDMAKNAYKFKGNGEIIPYVFVLKFDRPLIFFDKTLRNIELSTNIQLPKFLKIDSYTNLLDISRRKKGLITNEKFTPMIRFLLSDDLIDRNTDFFINSLPFTTSEELESIIKYIRHQLYINHLIESIKNDTTLEQFVLPRNIHDVTIREIETYFWELIIPTPCDIKLSLTINILDFEKPFFCGTFSNGEKLGEVEMKTFINVFNKSWSIPLSTLALMKKLGFDTKYNPNIVNLKNNSTEYSKIGNAWLYFIKLTKKWKKFQCKKLKNNVTDFFIDNPVILNGRSVDVLGTLIPIQKEIDMIFLKPKQTFYPSHLPNINNGQRSIGNNNVFINRNIQKPNVVVDLLSIKPKSDLEAMAEMGQNLSKDNNISSQQRGILNKYPENIIKTPAVIGKYPVQNDTSQFNSQLGGNIQNPHYNMLPKGVGNQTPSMISSDQNMSNVKHKKSKSKKTDIVEGVFKVPDMSVLPLTSVNQQPQVDDVETKKNKKDSVNKKSKKVRKNSLPDLLASVSHQQDSLKVTFSRLAVDNSSNKSYEDNNVNNVNKIIPNIPKLDFKIKHEILEDKVQSQDKNKDLFESGKVKTKLKKLFENPNQLIKMKGKNVNEIMPEGEHDKMIKQEVVISPQPINTPSTVNAETPPSSELKIKIKRPKITIKNLEPPRLREVVHDNKDIIKEEISAKVHDLSLSSPKVKEQVINKKGGITLTKSKSTNDAKERKTNKRKATDHTPSPRSKSSKKEKLDLIPPPIPEPSPVDAFNAIGKKNAFNVLKNFKIPKLEGQEEKSIIKPSEKNMEKLPEKTIEKVIDNKIDKSKEKPKDIKIKDRHKEREREREREKERERFRDKYKERDSSKRRSLSPINRNILVSPSKFSKTDGYKNEKLSTTPIPTDITKLAGFIPLAAIKPSTHTILPPNRHGSRSHSNSSDHYRSGSYSSSHSRKTSISEMHHSSSSSSRSHHPSSSSHNNHRSTSKSSIFSKSPLTSPTSSSSTSGSKWVKMSQPAQQPITIQAKSIDPRLNKINDNNQGKQSLVIREPSPCDLRIDESDC
uniref:Mediator complex subunit 1 n=1 Tax=Parastrongyloides trichosuri TaxID=131310 RepID=A0A0N4ZPK1_PARTI